MDGDKQLEELIATLEDPRHIEAVKTALAAAKAFREDPQNAARLKTLEKYLPKPDALKHRHGGGVEVITRDCERYDERDNIGTTRRYKIVIVGGSEDGVGAALEEVLRHDKGSWFLNIRRRCQILEGAAVVYVQQLLRDTVLNIARQLNPLTHDDVPRRSRRAANAARREEFISVHREMVRLQHTSVRTLRAERRVAAQRTTARARENYLWR